MDAWDGLPAVSGGLQPPLRDHSAHVPSGAAPRGGARVPRGIFVEPSSGSPPAPPVRSSSLPMSSTSVSLSPAAAGGQVSFLDEMSGALRRVFRPTIQLARTPAIGSSVAAGVGVHQFFSSPPSPVKEVDVRSVHPVPGHDGTGSDVFRQSDLPFDEVANEALLGTRREAVSAPVFTGSHVPRGVSTYHRHHQHRASPDTRVKVPTAMRPAVGCELSQPTGGHGVTCDSGGSRGSAGRGDHGQKPSGRDWRESSDSLRHTELPSVVPFGLGASTESAASTHTLAVVSANAFDARPLLTTLKPAAVVQFLTAYDLFQARFHGTMHRVYLHECIDPLVRDRGFADVVEMFWDDGVPLLRAMELLTVSLKLEWEERVRRYLESLASAVLPAHTHTLFSVQELARKVYWDAALPFTVARDNFQLQWGAAVADALVPRDVMSMAESKVVPRLIERLYPPAFRDHVKGVWSVTHRDQHTLRGFFRLLRDDSLCRFYEGVVAQLATASVSSVKTAQLSAERTSRKPVRDKDKVKNAAPAGAGSGKLPESPPAGLPSGLSRRCRRCVEHGWHWEKECPNPTISLPAKPFVSGGTPPKGSAASSAKLVQTSSESSSASSLAISCGGVRWPSVLDSGASACFICQEHAAAIMEHQPVVAMTAVSVPFEVETANGPVSVTSFLEADTVLHTGTVGDLHFPGLRLYVLPSLVGPALVGQSVLTTLSPAVLGPVIMESMRSVTRGEVSMKAYRAAVLQRDAHFSQELEVDGLEDEQGFEVGPVSTDDVRHHLQQALSQASAAGLESVLVSRLASALLSPDDVLDCFRLKYADDGPAHVPPIDLVPVEGAVLTPLPPRKYSPDKAAFATHVLNMLERFGYIERISTASFALPLVIVKKANVSPSAPIEQRFRACVDGRGLRDKVHRLVSSAPKAELYPQKLAGSTCFGVIDLSNAFFQLPYSPRASDIAVIQGPTCLYRSLRVLQGTQDGLTAMQSSVLYVLRELEEFSLVNVDDLLIFAASPAELTDRVLQVLRRLHAHNFKVHPGKLRLYETSVRYCGRQYSARGVTFDADWIAGLVEQPKPSTVEGLTKFLCGAGWMRQAIPDFARISHPLEQLMHESCAGIPLSKRSTPAQRSRIPLAHWGADHDSSFTLVTEALLRNVELSLPRSDAEWQVCLFCDASPDFWGAVYTNCLTSQLSLPVAEQTHVPLAFLSGAFRNQQLRWSQLDKEFAAVVFSLKKAQHLARMPGGLIIYNDCQDLEFYLSLNPQVVASMQDLPAKLERYRLYVWSHDYEWRTIKGTVNVVADYLSRMAGSFQLPELKALSARTRSRTKVSVSSGPVGVNAAMLFSPADLPDVAELLVAQLASMQVTAGTLRGRPISGLQLIDGLWVTESRQVYVPDFNHLRVRALVAAHAGIMGHRGYRATLARLTEVLWWEGVSADVSAMCHGCIHCARVSERTPEAFSMGSVVKPPGPNHTLHLDFVKVHKVPQPYTHDFEYVLVVKDGFTQFVELQVARAPTAEVVITTLLYWFSRFGVPKVLVSDQGASFTALVVDSLRGLLGVDHRFSISHCPFQNGVAERSVKSFLQCLRVLCAGAELNLNDWPSFVPLVGLALNHSPLPSLDGLAPVQVMTGLPAHNVLRAVYRRPDGTVHAFDTREKVWLSVTQYVSSIRSEMDDWHARVAGTSVAPHPRVNTHDFAVGEFVFRLYTDSKPRSKLLGRWLGPYEVISVDSAHQCTLRDIVTGKRLVTHVSHMKLFSDKGLHVSPQLTRFIAHSGDGYVLETIAGHRVHDDLGPQLFCLWRGFSRDEGTWEGVPQLSRDVPAQVKAYCNKLQPLTERKMFLDACS